MGLPAASAQATHSEAETPDLSPQRGQQSPGRNSPHLGLLRPLHLNPDGQPGSPALGAREEHWTGSQAPAQLRAAWANHCPSLDSTFATCQRVSMKQGFLGGGEGQGDHSKPCKLSCSQAEPLKVQIGVRAMAMRP